MHRKLIIGLGALALTLQAVPAMAQPAPTATAALDPASLAISRQIIAIVMPPEQRLAMVDRMEQAISAPMRANMKLPPELNDPGLSKLLSDYLDSLPGLMKPVLANHMPGLAEAMAHAYTRNFSKAELEHILDFAKTPVGSKYFARASGLLQDPDVAAVNGELFREGQQVAMKSAGEMQGKVRAYLAAHPDVAKRLSPPPAAK